MKKNNKKKEKITIDKLAQIVRSGFSSERKATDKKIDRLADSTDKKIENLAQMVARGFEQVDKRFEQVDKRFEGVDKRLDNIDARLSNVESEVGQIRVELKQIWNKLEEIEQKLEKLYKTAKEDADAIATDVIDLRRRVEFLENKIKEMQSA